MFHEVSMKFGVITLSCICGEELMSYLTLTVLSGRCYSLVFSPMLVVHGKWRFNKRFQIKTSFTVATTVNGGSSLQLTSCCMTLLCIVHRRVCLFDADRSRRSAGIGETLQRIRSRSSVPRHRCRGWSTIRWFVTSPTSNNNNNIIIW